MAWRLMGKVLANAVAVVPGLLAISSSNVRRLSSARAMNTWSTATDAIIVWVALCMPVSVKTTILRRNHCVADSVTDKTLTFKALTLSLALALAPALQADDWSQRLDPLLATAVNTGAIPGGAVVVVEGAQVVYAKGFGVARPDGTPVTPDTKMYLGSVSKSYLGLALVRLALDGRVDLDAAVTTYLPRFNVGGDAAITVRQLLNHTSGLSRYVGNRNQAASSLEEGALAEAVSELERYPLQSGPGERFDYSNANYQVLGRIVEVVTGQPFAEAMHTLVFAPLGLDDTRIRHPYDDGDAAAGYRFWLTTLLPFSTPMGNVLMPQGGVSSTIMDMGKYLVALATRDAWHAELARGHGLKESTDYASGWFVVGEPDDPLLFHHGLNAGFSAAAAFAPRRALGVAVLIHASDGFVAGDVNAVLDAVLNAVFEELPVSAVDFRFRWIQLAVLVLTILGILVWVCLFFRNPPQVSGWRLWGRVSVPSAMLLALAYVTGWWLPQLSGIPLSGIRQFAPDAGWVLTVCTWLALGWAVLRAGWLVVGSGPSRE